MTVVAAEAIPAVESTAATTAASTTGRAAASPKPRAPGRGSSFSDEAVRQRKAAKASQPQVTQITETTAATSQPGRQRTISLPDASLPEHNWHRWIMAEFVVAVVLVGASPFLKPAGPAAKAPSFATPLVRLTAVSLIYFILALMAQGPRSGKIAAAFGGLVLLGTAFNSLPEFTTLGQAFGSSGPPGTQTGLKAGETDETGGSGGREVPQ